MLDYFMLRLAANLKDDSTAEVVEKMATKTAYIASGVTVFSGLTVNEWGVIVGAAIGIITMLFNIWFKMRYLRPNKRNKHKISDRRKNQRGNGYE